MKARRQSINSATIENANWQHKERIEYYRAWLAKIDADASRKERLAACECVMCYDQSRIGGAACTDRQCAFCDTVLHSGNTNVDVVCLSCARKTGLCKHCGADLNLKNKRKRTLPEKTEAIDEH